MRVPLRITIRFIPVFFLLVWAAVPVMANAEPARELIANDTCLGCHEDKDLTKDLPDGNKRSLFVDEKIRQSSVHAKVNCADCHADLTAEHPDDAKVAKPVECASCHKEEARIYAGSIHGLSRAMGSSGAASCTSTWTHADWQAAHRARPASPSPTSQAGGVGTYADPITYAGSTKATPAGTIIYVHSPHVQRYFIMEDDVRDGPGTGRGGSRRLQSRAAAATA